LAAVSTYGGYFNGGLGIIFLALFSLWGWRDINQMNGLKTALSFLISVVSVAVFGIAGIVAWKSAFIMMAAALAGGYVGARVARRIDRSVVRGVVIAIGFVMTAIFFYRMI
jgi:uncharacterized membrane protein YfcA